MELLTGSGPPFNSTPGQPDQCYKDLDTGDIVKMDEEILAKFISGLNVVSYNYIDDSEDDQARIGLIAQEVQAVDPEIAKFFVAEDENGMLSIKPADLVFPLIATVQKLIEKVEALSKKRSEVT